MMYVFLMSYSTNLGCSSQSQWELLSLTKSSKLGSEARLSLKHILGIVQARQQDRANRTEEMLQMAKERVQRAEEKAQRMEERAKQAELQDGGMGQRIQQAEARADDLQRRLDEERRGHERLAVQYEERDRILREAKKRAQRAEERVQRGEERVKMMEEMLQWERERVQQSQERAKVAEERAQQERASLEQRVQRAETRVHEVQRRLDEVEGREWERLAVQQQAIAAEQRGPSWEVKTEDLRLTGEVIGTGGWAEVRVAHLKVAAKKLHSQLVYGYHQQLFQREMAVAARVSHPNLLRFYGAKLEGEMTILTELMPTSLRAEVERGHRHPEHHLSWEQIFSITVDVACALNYLHHLIPDPIIHRDLSSANEDQTHSQRRLAC